MVFSSAVASFNSHNWRCVLANMANKTRHFAACGRSDVKLRCSFPRVRLVLAGKADKRHRCAFVVRGFQSKLVIFAQRCK